MGHRHAERHGGAEDRHLALVAGHDRRLTAHLERVYPARLLNRRNLGVVAHVLSAASDVLDRTVVVMRKDGQLLLVVPRQNAVLGVNADAGHVGIVRLAERRAGGDPAAQQLVFIGTHVHALAAAVRRSGPSP